MIAETVFLSACLKGAYNFINREERAEKKKIEKEKRRFVNDWNISIINCNVQGIHNQKKQTFEILKYIPTEYGCKCLVSLPKGLIYPKFIELQNVLEASIGGIIDSDYNVFKRCIIIKMVTSEPDMSKPFTPHYTEEHELYFGDNYFNERIICNMFDYPHVIVTGATNMGKSVSILCAIANTIYYHKEVEFYFAQLSDKQDFIGFRNCKQTKGYVDNIDNALVMLQHVKDMVRIRTKLFIDNHVDTLQEWNEKFPDKKMHCIYVCADEFADFLPEDEKLDDNYKTKKQCYNLINEDIRKSRSAGIFFMIGIQRPDAKSMSSQIKANMNCKIVFGQNNEASSRVVIDTGEAVGLEQRHAIFVAGNKHMRFRTLRLDKNILFGLIKDSIESNHSENMNTFLPKSQKHKKKDYKNEKSEKVEGNQKTTTMPKPANYVVELEDDIEC